MAAASPVIVRSATKADIPGINDIHRYYIENTVITFIPEAKTNKEALANLRNVRDLGFPYLVADNDNMVLGFCYVSPFRVAKAAYRYTLELSLFLHPNHVRRGIGRQLLNRLIEILERPEDHVDYFEGKRLLENRPRQLMAVMAVDVDGPGNGLALRDWYLGMGFQESGRLKEVGWKKERWIDTVYLQRQIRD